MIFLVVLILLVLFLLDQPALKNSGDKKMAVLYYVLFVVGGTLTIGKFIGWTLADFSMAMVKFFEPIKVFVYGS